MKFHKADESVFVRFVVWVHRLDKSDLLLGRRVRYSVRLNLFLSALRRRACWTASSKGNSSEGRAPCLNGKEMRRALFDEAPRKTKLQECYRYSSG